MKIAIVILHFGAIDITKKCIKSLERFESSPYLLIVVNNTTQQCSAKDFTKKPITLINNKKNLGFAGGVNVGIQEALRRKVDAICLLNNDTQITHPFLASLEGVLESNKHIGIVGPAIQFIKNDKSIFDIGGEVSYALRTSHHEVKKITDTAPRPVKYISGCCMVITKEVFKKIGLFDTSFFLYYEDADFCLRAAKAGIFTYIVPSISIFHELSKTAGKMSHLAIFNLLHSAIIFGKKYAKNPLQLLVNRCFILMQALLFLKANPSSVSSITRALLQE